MESQINIDEDSLSDVSLIEDEDDEMSINQTLPDNQNGDHQESMEIDLPGDPITAPLDPLQKLKEGSPIYEQNSFFGWTDEEIQDSKPIKLNFDEFDDIPQLDQSIIRILPKEKHAQTNGKLNTRNETIENQATVSKIIKEDNKEQSEHEINKLNSSKVKFSNKIKEKSANAMTESPKLAKQVKKQPDPVPLNRRESREWRPSSMLFKPLSLGWVREVIYEENEDGSMDLSQQPSIIYHAPVVPGTKARTFKSQEGLQVFLNATEPTLSNHNFSFRKQPMNDQKGNEIIRTVSQNVEIFPNTKGIETQKETTKKSSEGRAKKSESSKQTTSKSISTPPIAPKGGLKVKMFSKMKEKNTQDILNDSDEPISDPNSFFNPEFSHSPQSSKVSVSPQSPLKQKSKIPPRDLPSSMTITPVSKVQEKDLPKPSSSRKSSSWNSHNKQNPILRPTRANTVSCSIHCPGNNGFPSLSCLSCQSMFHPACVGLVNELDVSKYDFYCSNCQPPVGKENSNPFSHYPSYEIGRTPEAKNPRKRPSTFSGGSVSKQGKFSSGKTPVLPRGLSITPAVRKYNSSQEYLLNGTAKPEHSLSKSKSLQGQSIVYIGGIKYLIVPHNPEAHKSNKTQNKSEESTKIINKLPILLKPSSAGDIPSFEVEETPEGKLLLIPSNGPLKKGTNPFNNTILQDKSTSAVKKSFNLSFTTDLSQSYFALMHVFRYLNLKDRLVASRVCRLWRDVLNNSSLWTSVSLKNICVSNWECFVNFMNKNRAQRLDLRKIIHKNGDYEKTWDGIKSSFSQLYFVTDIFFPPTSSLTVSEISTICPSIKKVVANSILPKELDLKYFHENKTLSDLSLKVSSGSLKITDSISFSTTLTNTLKRLSLLNLENLTSNDLTAISCLHNLEHLEIGKCGLSLNVFQFVKKLDKLKGLRIEGGMVEKSIGDLGQISRLEKLELIDVQLKEGFGEGLIELQSLRMLLLIPCYKDEVASINTELVDSVISLFDLTHFFLGLTNEWLESMSSLLNSRKESFPIKVNGVCEMYSLSKLFKTLSLALPKSKVKILKMSKSATGKRFIDNLKR